jgi:hypothetical protein
MYRIRKNRKKNEILLLLIRHKNNIQESKKGLEITNEEIPALHDESNQLKTAYFGNKIKEGITVLFYDKAYERGFGSGV